MKYGIYAVLGDASEQFDDLRNSSIMNETTFNQFRQNVKAYYKRTIRDSIEQRVLDIFHKYEDRLMTKYNSDSLKCELQALLNYYIEYCGMDDHIVYDVYNEIAEDYNNKHNLQSENSFVEESIQNLAKKYGY